MLISKSRYLSLFNLFFFLTKYFIIFGKVVHQGHRGLARTKDTRTVPLKSKLQVASIFLRHKNHVARELLMQQFLA